MTDIVHIPIEDVYPNPRNNRTELRRIPELAENIRANGQLTPALVVKDGNIYRLIAGERRLSALKLLGSPTIKAIVASDKEEADAIREMVAENEGHDPLTPVEHSMGVQEMLILGVDHGTIAASSQEPLKRVKAAAKGLEVFRRFAGDEPEQTDLDRFIAIGEFADDEEKAASLLKAPENEWRRIHSDFVRLRKLQQARDEAVALVAEAGCTLIERDEAGSHGYLGPGQEVPEGALYAYVQEMPWLPGVEVHWYGEASQEPEEVDTERQEREALRVELEALSGRRVAFCIHFLNDGSETTSNALRDAAWRLWHGGVDARSERAWEGVAGDLARFYASVLEVVEGRTTNAMMPHASSYSTQLYAAGIVDYLDALVACGYEITPLEVEHRDRIAEVASDG